MKVGLVEDRKGRERKMWKTESERTNRTCAISSDEEMEGDEGEGGRLLGGGEDCDQGGSQMEG